MDGAPHPGSQRELTLRQTTCPICYTREAMYRRALLIGLFALGVACGARTGLESPGDEDPDPPKACVDDPDRAPSSSCGPLSMPLSVNQACELTTCGPVDAEASVSLQQCAGCFLTQCDGGDFADHRLFVMNRLGRGHVVAWCDSTTARALLSSFDAFGYLGKSSNPRVASVGWYPCNIGIEGATYLGEQLPASYADGVALATDWDVLVACGAGPHGPDLADFGSTFGEVVEVFVHDEGRGLLALYDYRCDSEEEEPSREQLNAVVGQAGFQFSRINLGEQATGSVELACVPDYSP